MERKTTTNKKFSKVPVHKITIQMLATCCKIQWKRRPQLPKYQLKNYLNEKYAKPEEIFGVSWRQGVFCGFYPVQLCSL